MRNRWIGLIVAGIALAAAIWAYPQLPPRVATHWNFRGEADGYSGRFVAAFVFPLAILLLAGLAHVFPKIDPKGKNYPKFDDTYWLLINGVLIFAGVMHLALLGNAIGAPVSIRRGDARRLGLLVHRRRQLPLSCATQLVPGHPHAMDLVERHRLAKDASPGRQGVRDCRGTLHGVSAGAPGA